MNHNLVTGIDIGGSHITAALIDLQTHTVLPDSFIRFPVNSRDDAPSIIRQWSEAIAACRKQHPEASTKIGIAMPGPFDYDKGISYMKNLDKYDSLYQLNVKEMLADSLAIGVSDIVMRNDATCFLKGELFGGAAQNCKNVVGITLGTGLGSATCCEGEIHDGDLYCSEFRNGTAEDYLSTRWCVAKYQALSGITVRDVKEISEKVSTEQVATFLFDEFGKTLGEVLSSFIDTHHAEMVVIGGNIIKAWDLFIPETVRTLTRNSIAVKIIKADLGEEGILMGAGSLCA